MKKMLALVLSIVMLFTLFTGCGGDTQSEGSKDFRYACGIEAFTLDVSTNSEVAACATLELLVPPLVYLVNGEISNIVAERWEESEDGLTYTFYLKDDYVWENGDPVTAYDFQYSARRWADPATGSTSGGKEIDFILNANEIYEDQTIDDVTQLGVVATDDYTLEIRLNRPCPYFMELMARCTWLFPLNEKFVKECGTEYASSPETFMSCGPYTLESWVHDSELVLRKNPDFFDADKYTAETITRVMLDDDGTKVNMFETGDLDMIMDVGDEYLDDFRDQLEVEASSGICQILFNFDSPNVSKIMQNANFRKALSYALNRESIVAAVEGDNGTLPWNRVAAQNIPGVEKTYVEEYPLDVVPVKGDAEKAKEYLDAALKDLGYKSIAELPTIEFSTLEGSTYKVYAESIVDTWRQVLGLENIEIKQYPFMTLMGLQDDKAYDMQYWFSNSEIDAYAALVEFAIEYGPYTGWQDEKLENEINATNDITDETKRLARIAELEQQALDEGSFMILWQRGSNMLVADHVSGTEGILDYLQFESLVLA